MLENRGRDGARRPGPSALAQGSKLAAGEGARHAVKVSAGLPYWPRILRREQAAAYVGVSAGTFDIEVKEGRAPPPVFVTAS